MSDSVIEQLDTAISKAQVSESLTIISIDLRPMTHMALLKHLGLIGVAKWVEQYQSIGINVTYALSTPFRVNTERQSNL